MDGPAPRIPDRLIERIRAGRAAIVAGPALGPATARLLGRLPVHAIWTLQPTDLVEEALRAGTPAGWPERRAVRLLVDLAPAAVRRALAGDARLRALLGAVYRDGALVLVGFRPGAPELHALLERAFVMLDPPEAGEHVLVGAGVAPELAAEHNLTLVAGDDEPFLAALVDACAAAGLTLAGARPADDDLGERVVDALLARIELEHAPPARAQLLRQLARAYEHDIGDLPRAFTALTAAVRADPADEELVAEAERLAAETDGWGELVADLSEVVPHIADPGVAAGHWARLGRWYHDKLHHDDYALASYRAALKLDPARADARAGLEALYRRQQRWGELAESLAARAEAEAEPARRIEALLALGELHEAALASPARAAEAYDKVVGLDPEHDDALAALERLHRRGEAWGKLATVLERRAAIAEARDPARAAQARKELAQLRADKLGDVEGAIARWKAALVGDARDLDGLRALAAQYDKLGRGAEYLDTIERLASVSPDGERLVIWRRLAVEVEERHGGAARAIRAHERVLELDPGAVVAQKSLERLYRAEGAWEALVALHGRQIAQAPSSQRAELWLAQGQILAVELGDLERAAAATAHAVDLAPDHTPALAALAGLYRRLEAWDRAAATVERQAVLTPSAALWHEAAGLHADRLGDDAAADICLGRALELEPEHLPSLLARAALARRRGDWAGALARLLAAEQATSGKPERAALLHEAADLADEQLGQRATAVELDARVLVLDPEHVAAGRRVADERVAAQAWGLAEPVLEMLVRKGEPRHAQLAAAARALGRLDQAARHFRLALEADPDALAPALGLAEVLVEQMDLERADTTLREVLRRHGPTLLPGQAGDIWHRIGLGARARGDGAAAAHAFGQALALDPGHRPSLRQSAELAAERGDWPAVLAAKRAALAGAGPDEAPRLLEELGDVTAQRLGDAPAALALYLEALELRPRAHALLHKALDIYSDGRQWQRAVEVLDRLAAIEADPALRAKYNYAAGLIARDELGDADDAVARMGRVLDDDPGRAEAFEAIEAVLTERQDWPGLLRALKAMIRRLGDRATTAQNLHLWTRLGEIAGERLGDRAAAIAAHEVAAALDSGNLARHEQLAELYIAAGAGHVDKAAAELQLLLRRAPDHLDVYRRLHALYRSSQQRDKSYCLAQALVFLGRATEAQRAEALAGRPAKLPLARRRLTEELWQKAILHPREDRLLNAIFGLLTGPLAATTAQPHQALALNPRDQVAVDEPHPTARIFRYAAGVLGISPTPELYLRARGDGGVQAANVAEKGVLTPALIVSEPHVTRAAEAETAFEMARTLSFFRPERYVVPALQSAARLEAALAAALVSSAVLPAARVPDADKLAAQLARTVAPSVLEHVATLARKHPAAAGNGAIAPSVAGWIVATDLTANRVGLIVASDLETAARVIATEKHPTTTLGAKERLRELLGYWASEEHFMVRRHLGLEVGS